MSSITSPLTPLTEAHNRLRDDARSVLRFAFTAARVTPYRVPGVIPVEWRHGRGAQQ